MAIKSITPQDLHRHMQLGHKTVVLDVRPSFEYGEGHIKGAESYPLEYFSADGFIQNVCVQNPTLPTIYITCASGTQAKETCELLAAAGYEYLAFVKGGMRAWNAAGLPVQRLKDGFFPTTQMDIAQQIQIAVGSIVAIGTLLGTFVNTGFLAIPLLAGVGFAYEGFCGTQYLKDALLNMSWNKGA